MLTRFHYLVSLTVLLFATFAYAPAASAEMFLKRVGATHGTTVTVVEGTVRTIPTR
jgi:hypothetical protein